MTAVSLIPSALAELGISEMSPTVQKIGIICAFISFIWTGLKTKDHNVTGNTYSLEEDSEAIGLPKPKI